VHDGSIFPSQHAAPNPQLSIYGIVNMLAAGSRGS